MDTNEKLNRRFELIKRTSFEKIALGEVLPTSDFSIITGNDDFLQFKYINEADREKYKVKPGVFKIKQTGGGDVILESASFLKDDILQDYDFTSQIKSKVRNFFSKLPVYERYGVFAKRGMLLHGKPGVGKSQAINKISEEMASEGDTVVMLWATDTIKPSTVKSFLQDCEYDGNIKKMILIAEDIGGVEYSGAGKLTIEASLLSLLDGMEKTFQVPVFILATTNYPENLLEVLTDRPGRFEDIMEVPQPNADQRFALLNFFLQKDGRPEEDSQFIKDKKFDGLSIAHLKEGIIRAALYDLTIEESFKQVQKQSAKAKNDFIKKNQVGFGISNDDW